MSMLLAQVDRLRELADELNFQADFDTAQALRDAADTIWALRNKLADMVDQREDVERLKAENAKLRELVGERADDVRVLTELEAENAKLVDVLHEVESEAVYAYKCLQHDCEHMVNEQSELFRKYWHEQCVSDRIKAENAKLRDLVRLMHDTIKDMQETFGASVVVGGVELSAEYFESEYMRELGIEANDD